MELVINMVGSRLVCLTKAKATHQDKKLLNDKLSTTPNYNIALLIKMVECRLVVLA